MISALLKRWVKLSVGAWKPVRTTCLKLVTKCFLSPVGTRTARWRSGAYLGQLHDVASPKGVDRCSRRVWGSLGRWDRCMAERPVVFFLPCPQEHYCQTLFDSNRLKSRLFRSLNFGRCRHRDATNFSAADSIGSSPNGRCGAICSASLQLILAPTSHGLHPACSFSATLKTAVDPVEDFNKST